MKRKDVQRLAAELVDGIEQLRRDLALRDAQVQQLTAERDELLLALSQEGQRLQDENARLRAEAAAQRSLAGQLVVALAAQGSASFDEDTNLNMKRLAIAAWREANQ